MKTLTTSKRGGELNKEFVDLINKRLNIINAQTHIKSIKKHYESAITRLTDENAQFETAKSRIRLYVPDDKKTNSMNLKCAQEIYNTAFKDDLAELLQEVTILPLNIIENEKTLYLMIVQSIQSNLQYLLNLIVRLNDKTEEIRQYYSLEHVKAVNKI